MKRFLSILVVFALVLSLAPAFPVSAADETTWTKVDSLADIGENDTFAITVTVGGSTYVLPVVSATKAAESTAIPEITGTVSGNTLTVTNTEYSFGWSLEATDGGYHIKSGELYLFVGNSNNGIRITDKNPDSTFVWNVLNCGLLGATDGTSYRTLCVDGTMATPQWSSYSTTGAVADGTANSKVRDNVLGLWKLTAGEAPEETTNAPETTKAPEITEAPETESWNKVSSLADIGVNDTFAITVTVGGNTYVLPVVSATKATESTAIPEITATVNGNTLTIPDCEYSFGWSLEATMTSNSMRSTSSSINAHSL